MTNKIEGLQGLAKFFAGKAIERTDALDKVEREGGLNRFESKMLRLAKMIFEQEDGDTSTAVLILCEFANEVGFKMQGQH